MAHDDDYDLDRLPCGFVEHGTRVASDVAHRKLVEREIVVVALERDGGGKMMLACRRVGVSRG